MKRETRGRFFAWLLVVVTAFQPLLIEVVSAEQNAAMQTIRQQQQQFNQTYNQIMNLQPITIDQLTAKTLCIADSAKGQSWGTYEAKIKEANKSIEDAKNQARQAKTLLDLQAAQARAVATKSDGVKSDLVGTVKAKAQLQDGLRTAGEQIKNVGSMMSNISLALAAAYIVLVAVGAVTTLGVLSALVTPLSIASTALGIVGTGLTAAGDSLIASSRAGASTDNAVLVAIGCGVVTGAVTGVFTKFGGSINSAVSGAVGKGIGRLVGRKVGVASTLNGNIFKYIISHTRAYDKVSTRALNAAFKEAAPDGMKTVYDAAAVGVANQARQEALKEATTEAMGKILGKTGVKTSVSGVIEQQIKDGIPAVINTQPGITVPQDGGKP